MPTPRMDKMTQMKGIDIHKVSVTAPDPQPPTVPDHQDIPATVPDHQPDNVQSQNKPCFDGNTLFTTNHNDAQQSPQKLLQELNKSKKKIALLKKKLKASQQKNPAYGEKKSHHCNRLSNSSRTTT